MIAEARRSAPDEEPTLELDPANFAFDLGTTLSGVVSLRTRIPEDALTASVLGTQRSGHGVVIDERGLVLTIGYLITEATSVWLVGDKGHTAQGHVVAYDQDTGFGLVQTMQPMGWPALALGNSNALEPHEDVVVAGHGGPESAITAQVIAKREFAGYWEYVLDEAIFTAPSHPNWGGAALIGPDGKLLGIGSLLVQQIDEDGEKSGVNMMVPIDLLKPVLADLRRYGRPNTPPRPWLGWLVQEVNEHLVVAGVYDDCPAGKAGLKVGDVVLEVDGRPVSGLAELFRRIWALGEAGVAVPFTILRDSANRNVIVTSVDRNACLRSEPLH